MPPPLPAGEELVESLFEFSQGMNSGIAAVLLPNNQLAFATNATVRGTFVTDRPKYRKVTITFPDNDVQNTVTKGLWQGGTYYKPDVGLETLVVAISGRLFQFVPIGATATVIEVTGGNPQDSNVVQAWLWQAEKWVIWNDGINLPVFFDGTSTRRSLGGANTNPVLLSTTTTAAFTVPPFPPSANTVTVQVVSTANLLVGDSVTFSNIGSMLVGSITDATHFVAISQSGTTAPPGTGVVSGTTVNWSHPAIPGANELPAGRMGAYGLGRNWMSLTDGKQFIASDIVGGASGTPALDYRDAVLKITENAYLVGGGNFTVPGSIGEIRAMVFGATLDVSLGQGPLQVYTPTHVFSCQAPVDRLTWATVTNPILTESLISNGGLGQNSTVQANGDTFFRSLDGIRSLVLARKEFYTWGNVPISREISKVLDADNQVLLALGSAVTFDNRLLMTATPVQSARGVYHAGLVAINFDPLSSMSGKLPSVYDGLWTGLNALQIITGIFSLVQKCYAFSYRVDGDAIELWEVLPSADAATADSNGPVSWPFDSPVLFREADTKKRRFKRLTNGELYVDQLVGTVNFQVYYRPDDYPAWIPWLNWTETQDTSSPTGTSPTFRPRMGLGEPSASPCDSVTNRPLREGHYFQVKVIGTGHFRFKGGKFMSITLPEPRYAPPNCSGPQNSTIVPA